MVAQAVLLEGLPGAVRSMTVGLDNHSLVAPDEVHADRRRVGVAGVDERVDFRHRQAGSAAGGEECFLELAPRRRRADVVLVEDCAQALGGGTRFVSLDLVEQRVEIEQLQDLGLVERSLQRAAFDDLSQVEQRAGDGGAGDAVSDGDVRGGERRRAVDVDAGVLAGRTTGDRDVDVGPGGASDLV
jgi:hypothetical protein